MAVHARPIYLLTVYAKSRQRDLTPVQKRVMIALIDQIKAEWTR